MYVLSRVASLKDIHMKKTLLVFSALTFSSTINLVGQAQPSPGAFPSGGPGGGNGQWQGGSGQGAGPGSEEHRQKMMRIYDTNHDGVLDDSERMQMREAMQKRRMQERNQDLGGGAGQGPGAGGIAPDKPGQGFGSPPTQGGANGQQWEGRRQRMLQKFDANHDGQLDDGERAQMREFMQKRRMERQQQGGGAAGGPAPGGVPDDGLAPK